MPYIKPEHRKALDPYIEKLAVQVNLQFHGNDLALAGLLNYTCTKLALQIIRRRFGTIRYWMLAMLCGVFGNIADEIYRRVGVPYEDRQKDINGDLAEFKE